MQNPTINLTVEYKPEVKDGFTSTAAHFIVTTHDGPNGASFRAAETTEEEATKQVRELAATAFGLPTGISGTAYYRVNIGRINYIDLPAEKLERRINLDHEEAIREDMSRTAEQLQAKIKERFTAESAKHLTQDERKQISLDQYSNNRVEVNGIRRHSYGRIHQLVQTHRFPMTKSGSWNWPKIKEAAAKTARFIAQERADEVAKTSRINKANEVLTAIGATGQDEIRVTDGSIHVTFRVTDAEQLQTVKAALAIMGIEIK